MSIVGSNALAGASGQAGAGAAGFKIDRSLRFSDSASSHLSKTFSSAGNRKTWTWSGWVKRGSLDSSVFSIFAAYDSSNTRDVLRIESNKLNLQIGTSGTYRTETTDAVFRDPSAWYHIIAVFDSTQSTAADRLKFYVNGVEQSVTGTPVDQNTQSTINNADIHYIGARSTSGSARSFFDGYITEVHFVDGQALASTDFGEYDSNNVWQPKEFAGTYGTNGFHLPFSDNSSNAALGTDSSGNSNTWTVNNLVATAPGLSTANQGFDVLTYTGNGSSQTVSGLAFQPDFVWYKNQASNSHKLFDSIRGATKVIYSNYNGAEQTITSSLSAFTSSGFTVGSDAGSNTSGNNYVAWCWKAGGTATSNTDGTITSLVSANPSYGFSIVQYTLPSSGTFTVGHGLNAEIGMIIMKDKGRSSNWNVWHSAFTSEDDYINLNSTGAKGTATDFWGASAPGNSTFGGKVGTSGLAGNTEIAYCWAPVDGFSKFGTYTGNASATGPVITLGFKPKFILIKSAGSGHWMMIDTKRNNYDWLFANLADAQASDTTDHAIDILDDGFQIKSAFAAWNTNGQAYTYAAFAEKPSSEIIDSLLDTPTNYEADSGNNNGGNYATLNPLSIIGNVSGDTSKPTFSNGNLTYDGVSGKWGPGFGSIAIPSSGKWYFEATISSSGSAIVGIAKYLYATGNRFWDQGSGTQTLYKNAAGSIGYSGTSQASGTALSAGDIVGVGINCDDDEVKFYRNGSLEATVSTPSNVVTAINNGEAFPFVDSYNGIDWDLNFGQRPFSNSSIPTGFLSLCTQNLPDPTIADGSTAFDVVTRPGGGVTKTFSTLRPGFVWEKRRDSQSSHYLFDVNRGNDKYLITNNSTAEGSSSGAFTFNTNSYAASTAFDWPSNATVVDWVWDAGTSTVSNTDGSITSSVRANASAGFSIIKYSIGSASSTIDTFGTGLNAAPAFVILKPIDDAQGWTVYHKDIPDPTENYLHLESTAAYTNSNTATFSSSNSTFGCRGTRLIAQGNSASIIVYCFVPIEGYSAFGSYTGNGSADGPFVFTGMRPALIITKRTDSTGGWVLWDTARNPSNLATEELYPDDPSGEYTGGGIDILSNGFKLRNSSAHENTSGGTYVYAAFAEHPFKTSRAR